MARPSRLIVLDFDGTVCLGDAPVLSYARHLDDALARRHGAESGGVIERTLAVFLSGPQAVGALVDAGDSDVADLAMALDAIVDSADGYAAAARLAGSRGVNEDELSGAYEASRRELAAGTLETWAPQGLSGLLATVRETTRLVLVTNATETGVAGQLEHLGLGASFDEVVTSAGKPRGMPEILRRLRRDQGLADAPERLLSVGDIWRNDLAPAAEQGSATALIERFGAADASPTFRASTFEELYAPITAWALRP